MITRVTTHLGEALANLLHQLQGKENIEKFLGVFLGKVQELEDALYEVLTLRWLSTAEGEQLDGIGRILNLERDGRTDEEYRTRLGVEILVLKSQGTCEELFAIIVAFIGDTNVVTCSEGTTDADLDMEITEPIANGPEVFLAWKRAKAAGVRGVLAYPDLEMEGPWFSLGPDPDLEGESVGLDDGGFITSNLGGFGIAPFEEIEP